MDYGKLAYLKAEELEQRLLSFNRDEESRSLHIAATLNGASGSVPIAIVSGTGSVGFVAKVYARAPQGKKVYLTVGDSVSGEAAFNADGEAIVIGSAFLGNGDTVGLLCDDETAVDKVEIVFCGNASIAARAFETAAVGLDDVAGIITATLGRIKLTVADAAKLDVGVDAAEGVTVGFGSAAAITAYGGKFKIAYASEGHVTLAEADKSGLFSVMREFDVDGTVTDIALGYAASRLIIAYIIDGEIGFRFADSDFDILSGEVRSGIRADKVMVAGTEKGCIVYSFNGKCFLKMFEKTLAAETKLKLTSSVAFSSAEE